MLSKGRFTALDPPGPVRTKPTAISNRGQVLFKYLDASGAPLAALRDPRGVHADSAGVLHGFLRDANGRYRTVDVPGAAATGLADINDRGQITGSSKPPPGTRATLPPSAARTGDRLLNAP